MKMTEATGERGLDVQVERFARQNQLRDSLPF
jgi:hypothetical protein